jgi:hypothetical protein
MQDVVSVPHEKTKKQKNPKQSKVHVGCVVCLFHRNLKDIVCKSSHSLESFSFFFNSGKRANCWPRGLYSQKNPYRN